MRQMRNGADVDFGPPATLEGAARLVKSMRSARDISNAKISGSYQEMLKHALGVLTSIREHLASKKDVRGNPAVRGATTDRKEMMDALLPREFTTGQNAIDEVICVFCSDPNDGRVSIAFHRNGKAVAVDHVDILNTTDPRVERLIEVREILERQASKSAVADIEDALGLTRHDDVVEDAPSDHESDTQDGDPDAFRRVHDALPDTGPARRIFDLVRPYRDPSYQYPIYKHSILPSHNLFLAYCLQYVKPLKATIAKAIDYRPGAEGSRRRNHAKIVKGAFGTVAAMPMYGTLSRAFEESGRIHGPAYVSIEGPSVPSDMLKVTDASRPIIVDLMDPDLIDEIQNGGHIGCRLSPTNPITVMFLPKDGKWSAVIGIGNTQLEGIGQFSALDPCAVEEMSSMVRMLNGHLREALMMTGASDDRTSGPENACPMGRDSAKVDAVPLVARIRLRVEDPEAAGREVESWHRKQLERNGPRMVRSRCMNGECLVEHLDSQDHSRRWSVRIYREDVDRHVLTVELGADPGDSINPRMPIVVHRIASSTQAIGPDGTIARMVRRIGDRSSVEEIHRRLCDPTRMLPVAIVSSRGDERLIEPESLRQQTIGAIDVWAIEDAAYDLFEERVGPDMGVRAGEIRIYMPGFTPDDSSFDHPTIHLSRSGLGRLAQILTSEIGATLWRYPAQYRGHDHSAGVLALPGRVVPDPLPETMRRGEPTLPRIPSYKEVRRRIIPASARSPSPSSYEPAKSSEVRALENLPEPTEDLFSSNGDVGTDIPVDNETNTSSVETLGDVPSDDARDGERERHVGSHDPNETAESKERDAEPDDTVVTRPDAVHQREDAETSGEKPLDDHPSGDQEPVQEQLPGFLPTLNESVDAGAQSGGPDEIVETTRGQRMDDTGDESRSSATNDDHETGSLRLVDIETLFELYTDQMGQSQAAMNMRLDEAVDRIDSISRTMIERMGLDPYSHRITTGVDKDRDRMRESDARRRSHEAEIDEMKDEMRRLRAALEAERLASAARGVQPRPYPRTMNDVREWFDATLAGRVHIVSKAWRTIRKMNNEYPAHAVERMCRALEILGGPGLDMHAGDESAKERWMTGLAGLRVEQSYDSLATCGHVARQERTVSYQGEKLFTNRHLRGTESGHNDRDLLRIYYVHHAETNQIVVGHLPTHLTTQAS